MTRAIIIVTGANSGVGFGICQRLLLQLSRSSPPDAKPQKLVDPLPSQKLLTTGEDSYDSLTLILACRNLQRAAAAREQLYLHIDTELLRRRRDGENSSETQYAQNFRQGLVVDLLPCDLASAQNTLKLCQTIREKYPYVSHVFCNAGVGSFTGIDFVLATKQILTGLSHAVTHPLFKIQSMGETSPDGLGWVWQCNLFGHYLLVRNLISSLEAAPRLPARVLWTSSIESTPISFNPEDWQLLKTPLSYEASKYEIEIVGHRLNAYRASENAGTAVTSKIRHFIVHPGVVGGNMFKEIIGPILDMMMIMVFYLARFLGSPNHVISKLSGAHSATHVALVPLPHLPPVSEAVRYGTQTDRIGRSYVNAEPIEDYGPKVEEMADGLIRRCDELCRGLEMTGRKSS